jgi:hypothetical protein
MNKTALKNAASTQRFIEIVDIVDDIVVMANGNACTIIEVKATNFALLSADEQDVKIYSYASLLNSLSFPIQILIRSKRLDVSSYIKLLDDERTKTQNPLLAKQMALYQNFVQELVKVNTILEKKFYIVISYSSLEKGVTGATQAVANSAENDFVLGAKASLHSKTESLFSQLARLGLKAEILGKEKLVKLFYDIFNDQGIEHQETEHMEKAMILGKEGNHAGS